MGCEFLNEALIGSFPEESFRSTTPFPWHGSKGFLRPEAFDRLHDDFPSLELFERHEGMQRPHGQRPHDRYYLAYESNLYHEVGNDRGPGTIAREELAAPWQRFLDEILGCEPYLALASRLFGQSRFRLRFAWHLGFTGSEVSPHIDSPNKLGTHIFFFNRGAEWDPAWGGSTLVLQGKRGPGKSPDFSAFSRATPVDICDASSFLFKNTPDAWHGVEALSAPPGHYRRLFNVIFELEDFQQKPPPLWKRARRAARRLVSPAYQRG
jgi:hypothetical protein